VAGRCGVWVVEGFRYGVALSLAVARSFHPELLEHSTMAPSDRKTEIGYTQFAKIMHWLIVALLVFQYVVAWTMPNIGRNTTPEFLINQHFSLGVLILIAVAVRLGWRWTHREPSPAAGVPPWQVHGSRAVHYLLYFLLFVIPILGWMNASFRGFDVTFFGLFKLPQLVSPRAPGFAWTGDIHSLASTYLLLGFAGLHVAAALYHWLIRKDRVLQRMLPGG
jgi:cytochrome b561